MSERDLLAYKYYLTMTRKLKPSSVSSYFQTIRSFYEWVYQNGLIKHNPARSIVTARRHIKRLDLTCQDIRDLANRQLAEFVAFMLMVYTGLTPDEVAGIRVTDLHLKAPGWISLPEDTAVMLNPEVHPMLMTYIKRDRPQTYLFHDKENQPIPTQYFTELRRRNLKIYYKTK